MTHTQEASACHCHLSPLPPKQLSTSKDLGRILADAGNPHTYYSRCLSPRLDTLLSSYCVLTPLLETGVLCGSLRPFLPCEHTCLSSWFGASQPLTFFGYWKFGVWNRPRGSPRRECLSFALISSFFSFLLFMARETGFPFLVVTRSFPFEMYLPK